MRVLSLGTRGSALAMAQSRWVAAEITRLCGLQVELVVMSTRGDRVVDRPLAAIGGKGLFTAELEEALHESAIDLAVHSLKDLPTTDPEGLVLAAVPVREDPRDAWVGPAMTEMVAGAKVGTDSLRRRVQLGALAPAAVAVELRGNVDTRLRKLDQGEVQAAVLAMAGLRRLGIQRTDIHPIDVDLMLPAVGQGALAIQTRAGDTELRAALALVEDGVTRTAVDAERAFLRAWGGGCNVPAGAYARVVDGRIDLRVLAEVDGELRRSRLSGTDTEALGSDAAARLR